MNARDLSEPPKRNDRGPPWSSSELCMRNLLNQNTLWTQLSLSQPTVSQQQHRPNARRRVREGHL